MLHHRVSSTFTFEPPGICQMKMIRQCRTENCRNIWDALRISYSVVSGLAVIVLEKRATFEIASRHICRYRLISIVTMYLSSSNQAQIYSQRITGPMYSWGGGTGARRLQQAPLLSDPHWPLCNHVLTLMITWLSSVCLHIVSVYG